MCECISYLSLSQNSNQQQGSRKEPPLNLDTKSLFVPQPSFSCLSFSVSFLLSFSFWALSLSLSFYKLQFHSIFAILPSLTLTLTLTLSPLSMFFVTSGSDITILFLLLKLLPPLLLQPASAANTSRRSTKNQINAVASSFLLLFFLSLLPPPYMHSLIPPARLSTSH